MTFFTIYLTKQPLRKAIFDKTQSDFEIKKAV